MKQKIDYEKEQCRGTLKQIMKVRGLRTISLANYFRWLYGKNANASQFSKVHSLKLDLQDGYINAFGYASDARSCGDKISSENETSIYQSAMEAVNSLLNVEDKIPYKVKRNILVKLSR